MRKKPLKSSIEFAQKSLEQASAVLVAVSLSAERMDATDISIAIDACSGLVNDALSELAIMEAGE
ncbi:MULTISPECIES: hypothetical protein [Enterobacter]|uniref:hypothetical protein n=1 Tax=Enterobacter TaxID=547 RepID=UPI001CC0332A|nr:MULTISPECIES: hypothetical protein [Enterobacter]MCG7803806.1 hypothetical protein [Enterobacter asburiae]UAN20963.1 hypothetical protein KGP25_17520 [Enterobacter sp. JBIWA003]UAN30798.1 hypothetical protein KGP22_16420 [Enterobacter sp. JBIWA005]